MDHQDIIDLINAGKTAKANALIAERDAQQGISGHDHQIIDAALKSTSAEKRVLAAESRAEVVEDAKAAAEKQSAAAKAAKATRARARKSAAAKAADEKAGVEAVTEPPEAPSWSTSDPQPGISSTSYP